MSHLQSNKQGRRTGHVRVSNAAAPSSRAMPGQRMRCTRTVGGRARSHEPHRFAPAGGETMTGCVHPDWPGLEANPIECTPRAGVIAHTAAEPCVMARELAARRRNGELHGMNLHGIDGITLNASLIVSVAHSHSL
jgi:hypothetical protein